MSDLWGGLQRVWDKIEAGPAVSRAHFSREVAGGQPFKQHQHYFQILINELFLANEREYFVKYAPVAFVATTYQYGRSRETNPKVVGPSIFSRYSQDDPHGRILQNVPVTNLHPYVGGALTLTVIFNKVQQANNAHTVLSVLDTVAEVANPVTPAVPFATYLTLARGIMDGVQTLLNLPETDALLGYQITINPDIGHTLKPMHIVLIDADEGEIDKNKFWIKESRLYYGQTEAEARPYREHDFILLQIAQGSQRSDEEILPFYPLWEETRALALKSNTEERWREAKGHFNTLKYTLTSSPDLTRPDYERLLHSYLDEILRLRREAVSLAVLSAEELAPTERETALYAIADQLDALDEV